MSSYYNNVSTLLDLIEITHADDDIDCYFKSEPVVNKEKIVTLFHSKVKIIKILKDIVLKYGNEEQMVYNYEKLEIENNHLKEIINHKNEIINLYKYKLENNGQDPIEPVVEPIVETLEPNELVGPVNEREITREETSNARRDDAKKTRKQMKEIKDYLEKKKKEYNV